MSVLLMLLRRCGRGRGRGGLSQEGLLGEDGLLHLLHLLRRLRRQRLVVELLLRPRRLRRRLRRPRGEGGRDGGDSGVSRGAWPGSSRSNIGTQQDFHGPDVGVDREQVGQLLRDGAQDDRHQEGEREGVEVAGGQPEVGEEQAVGQGGLGADREAVAARGGLHVDDRVSLFTSLCFLAPLL